MNRTWAALGAGNAFFSVAAGAFGAHALKGHLTPDRLAIFETGARYQMYHGLGLLGLSVLMGQGLKLGAPAGLMAVGIVLFSGSLYAMALGELRMGAVTPLGGLCFLIAWAWVAVTCLRR